MVKISEAELKQCSVDMEYIGDVLSVNHYKYLGRWTKPQTKWWMAELGWLLKQYHIEDWKLPLKVIVSGRFRDKRSQPDLHNLMKVICDSIEEVTGINDKCYRTETGESIIDNSKDPMLFITIIEIIG